MNLLESNIETRTEGSRLPGFECFTPEQSGGGLQIVGGQV